MALKDLITNSLTEEYQNIDEIWRKVNNGLHQRTGLDRTLRLLSEQGFIEKEVGRVLRYRKKVRQLDFIS